MLSDIVEQVINDTKKYRKKWYFRLPNDPGWRTFDVSSELKYGITKEEYDVRINTLKAIDLTKVMELDDTVDFGQVAACAGGACEIA